MTTAHNIPDRLGINGLRLRVGNVQIGEPRLLDEAFPEPRFNAWAVGECHVISPKLIPNARRDNFEQDTHYANLINHLTPRAKTIAKACRVCSAERTSKRMQVASEQNAVQPSKAEWDTFKRSFSQTAQKPVSSSHRRGIQKMLRADGTTYSELMDLLYGLKIKQPTQ